MAQVAHDHQLSAWVDDYLDYLIDEWRSVPLLAREWAAWNEHGRLVFALDWPIREDRLHQLAQWHEQGRFTPAQCDRYEELLRLVREHRPVLDGLLRDS